jgi:ParB family transcriptional regulator, chromosome partitioning protein
MKAEFGLSCLGIIQEITLNKLSHPVIQLRQKLDNLDALAYSIKEHGLLQPIIVRPIDRRYEIVAGNRRYEAVRMLGLRKINCHLVELSDQESYELALTENMHQKTMNPIEEAIAFNRYVKEFGWGGVSYLALTIGRSQEYVSKRIQLLSLPQNIISDIINEEIPPSTALELLPLDGIQIQGLSKLMDNSQFTKNQIRQIVKDYKTMKDCNYNGTACYDLVHEHEADKAFKKAITVLKSALISWDDILREMNDDWFLREIFMEYRIMMHGGIDTFLGMRKRIRKLHDIHLESNPQLSNARKKRKLPNETNEASIHVWKPSIY